jgi:hypothetical protein
MTDTTSPEFIDLNLVDQIMEVIPPLTWPTVLDGVINQIIDAMPSDVLLRLTGDPIGFEEAERILFSYYAEPEREKKDLILDAFRCIGEEQLCYFLDSLDLEKLNKRLEQRADTTPCSVEETKEFNDFWFD